jgi:hypothetical protein
MSDPATIALILAIFASFWQIVLVLSITAMLRTGKVNKFKITMIPAWIAVALFIAAVLL